MIDVFVSSLYIFFCFSIDPFITNEIIINMRIKLKFAIELVLMYNFGFKLYILDFYIL